MGNTIIIDYDKIYKNKQGEEYKIIDDLGRCNKSCHDKFVKLKFLKSNSEKIISYNHAIKGNVIDDMHSLRIGEIDYSLMYGPFSIISYEGIDNDGDRLVKIHFQNTGNEYVVKSKYANECRVSDIYIEKIYPTIDQIPPLIYDNLINENLKNRWRAILNRCYNINDKSYSRYGLLGVYVHPVWYDLDRFLKTIRGVNGFTKYYRNPSKYHIDKDYIQFGQPSYTKFYSPLTCMFLSDADNTNLSILEKDKDIKHEKVSFYLSGRHFDESNLFGIQIKELKDSTKRYSVYMYINSKNNYLGTYSDIDAAIEVYNVNYMLYGDYELVPLFNKHLYKTMSYEEAQKYKVE